MSRWPLRARLTLAFALVMAIVLGVIGLKLRASRADPVAAEALGANVVRLRYAGWILSGAIMGMGGAIWAQYNLAFDPKQFFFTQTFNILAMIVVGLHIYHGVWSALQTLGLHRAPTERWRRGAAAVIAAVIVAGYVAIPVAVLAGWLR